MVLEIAEIDIVSGLEFEFEQAASSADILFAQQEGWLGASLYRSVEVPSRYHILARWRTVEDHTVAFRNSDSFAAWRALVGEFFATAPRVEHLNLVHTLQRSV